MLNLTNFNHTFLGMKRFVTTTSATRNSLVPLHTSLNLCGRKAHSSVLVIARDLLALKREGSMTACLSLPDTRKLETRRENLSRMS